ncbi:glycoside hydrolase family 15 protein [Kitasatospora sp. NPDC048540]|uniref:glycoside hydrolase family 15 protein n=1 Tax=unclassified Kitasatospora TaxID=2633591 RepID=UPI000539A732|nr:glycoside hydrolase family 15 protein [Kitasatospora sp. MBT63]
MTYRPVEEYGIIGDMHSAALVGTDGSIDWYCLPRFDSPSVFARILDDEKGGYFRISVPGCLRRQQMYLPDTCVLVTRFLSDSGVGEVIDFMPVDPGRAGPGSHQIVRVAKSIRGSTEFRLDCMPAFNFARDPHTVEISGPGALFRSDGMSFTLRSRFPLARHLNGVSASFTLGEGESTTFLLGEGADLQQTAAESRIVGDDLLRETVTFWKRWLGQCTYRGRWREMVNRSILTLKLLTYDPTGAIVAAPTTSLPEELGGPRNWDYRYTWMRDAALTLIAFMQLGFTGEAEKFMAWLEERAVEDATSKAPLQLMYRVDGTRDLTETHLDHLDGYRGSRPVRVGNLAVDQLQLDIYGELLAAVEIYDRDAKKISYDLWTHLVRMLDWVADNWRRSDEGIWEIRGGRHHFVYSKVQCWVALDRGLRIADRRSFPLDRSRIQRERDLIFEAVMQEGYRPDRGSFVQHFATDALDASILTLPIVGFVAPSDPRMLGTLARIRRELSSDSLVYRYSVRHAAADGIDCGEGTFNICTFWLVEALARAGEVEEARFIFEKMLTYANHVGLFGEETSPSGEVAGNYPQAFTHLSLINAAFALNEALGGDV